MILILIYVIALEGVFFFIIILSSSFIKLLVLYNGYNGNNRGNPELEFTKIIKVGILLAIDPNTYSLPN